MAQPLQDLSHLRVLAVFAHPDDEGFGSGGLLALLAARDARLTLVCATNGDVGEISDPDLATPETLAQVRQQELREAMKITGVPDLRFLNYRDSGMAGTADNDHPDALRQADPDHVVGQIVAIIREVQPDLVIAHDPSGGYGHPDHQAVCWHTTRAFSLAADPASYPQHLASGLELWAPKLLYYVCFPRSRFRRMWQEMLDLGITPPFASLDIDSLGTPDDEVTTVVDVGDYAETKIASLNCHRTQISSTGPFARLPEESVREYMSTEYYALVMPEGAGQEEDLLGRL